MSETEFHGHIGLLAVSGLVLAVLAVLVHMFRSRRRARRRRLAAGLTQQQPYAAPPAPTPLTPFPPPPPPLASSPPRDERPDHQQHRSTYQPLPSGLPTRPDGPAPPAVAAPPAPAPAGGGGTAWPDRPRHAEPRTPAGGPEPDAQAGHDTHGQHSAAPETSTRLRRPAYLRPDAPGVPTGGRHRAGDDPGRPDEWEGDGTPPGEWPRHQG